MSCVSHRNPSEPVISRSVSALAAAHITARPLRGGITVRGRGRIGSRCRIHDRESAWFGPTTTIAGPARPTAEISARTWPRATSARSTCRNVPCDILLAGPPCQDFSQLWNHDGARTARGNLFREVARFLAEMKPAGFVLENVPGLLSANRGAAWTIVRHALRAPASFLYGQPGVRYNLSAQVVDMADLGVPQHRERLLVLGVRRDLGIRPPIDSAAFGSRSRQRARGA